MKTESHETAVIAAHLRACEEALLDPAVRKDRARICELLTKDFQEFGASGRTWTRDEILDELAAERSVTIRLEDFRCVLVAEEVALVTYRSVREQDGSRLRSSSLRSSIWVKKDKEWKLCFHQGTRAS